MFSPKIVREKAFLTVTPKLIKVTKIEGSALFSVNTNLDEWEVDCLQFWVDIVKKGTSFVVKYDNNNGRRRTAAIVVSGQGILSDVTVIQD